MPPYIIIIQSGQSILYVVLGIRPALNLIVAIVSQLSIARDGGYSV